MSKLEKILLLPVLLCFISMLAGMLVYCIYLKETEASIVMALICSLMVYLVLIYPRFLPFLGLDEMGFIIYKRKKERSIPFSRVVLIQVLRRERMNWIVAFDSENKELFSVPYQKALFNDLLSLSGQYSWRIVK